MLRAVPHERRPWIRDPKRIGAKRDSIRMEFASSRTCPVCDRSFARTEHCARHVLTHSEHKPFPCSKCHRQFRRQDVLRRHVDRYCHANPEIRRGDGRVRRACNACCSHKIKCNGQQPCQQCSTRQRDCTYQQTSPVAELQTLNPPTVETLDGPYTGFSVPPSAQGMRMMDDPAISLPFEAPVSMTWLDSDDFMSFLYDDILLSEDMVWAAMDAPIAGETAKSSESDGIPELVERFKGIMGTTPAEADLLGSSRSEQFLKQPLHARKYDLEVIKALLQLFERHISPVFRSFTAYSSVEGTLPEQVLAMAAVGAAFSNAPGAAALGRVLAADSHRMNFHTMAIQYTQTGNQLRSYIQTLIALQIFGLIGGNKRAHEIGEGYHHALYRALQELFHHPEQSSPAYPELLDDTIIIECYFMLMTKHSPICAPSQFSAASNDRPIQLLKQQRALVAGTAVESSTTYLDIALLANASWLAAGAYSSQTYEACCRRWSAERIESSMSRLADECERKGHYERALLCHTIIVVLLSPIESVLDIASAAIGGEERPIQSHIAINNWQLSTDYFYVRLHASMALKMGQKLFQSMETTNNFIETPHDAYCIYLCTLIIWIQGVESPEDHSSKTAPLSLAIELISKSQVSISTNMRTILSNL